MLTTICEVVVRFNDMDPIFYVLIIFPMFNCKCVAAFASDLIFISMSLNPDLNKGLKATSVSLDPS